MPTALQLGRAGWKPYVEAARARRSQQPPAPADAAQREDLLNRARDAARELKTRYGARKVTLFGSLALAGACVSDVDLAVEGLSPGAYWDAWAAAERIIGDRRVDVIEVETASASLKQAIERQGIEL